MKKNSTRKAFAPKRILRLPDLDYSKTAVQNSLSSADSRRSYRFAIDDSHCGTAQSQGSLLAKPLPFAIG